VNKEKLLFEAEGMRVDSKPRGLTAQV